MVLDLYLDKIKFIKIITNFLELGNIIFHQKCKKVPNIKLERD